MIGIVKFNDQAVFDEAAKKIARKDEFEEYDQYKVTIRVELVMTDTWELMLYLNIEVILFDYKIVTTQSKEITFKEEELCPDVCCSYKQCIITNNYHIVYQFLESND